MYDICEAKATKETTTKKSSKVDQAIQYIDYWSHCHVEHEQCLQLKPASNTVVHPGGPENVGDLREDGMNSHSLEVFFEALRKARRAIKR